MPDNISFGHDNIDVYIFIILSLMLYWSARGLEWPCWHFHWFPNFPNILRKITLAPTSKVSDWYEGKMRGDVSFKTGSKSMDQSQN